MTSRKKDIEILLSEMMDLREIIKSLYEQSLEKKEISPRLKVKIKCFFECARSALDYAAHDIADYCNFENKDHYFPIISNSKNFPSHVKGYLGDVENRNQVLYQYLESIQPYHEMYKWLKDFKDICNTKKHDVLVQYI